MTRLPLISWAEQMLAPMEQEPARHHRLLLDALANQAPGGRLMVLMPPGSAKSTYASVLFPAWFLAANGRASVIAASHTASLAEHFGRQVRNLFAEHPAVLGCKLCADNRAAGRWRTDAGGEYFAAGVRGPITGRRADLAIIDDPVKSWAEADSAEAREHVWNWYRADLSTRLKPGGRIVLIMTRWHEDDLGGRLLAGGEAWQTIRLPALAEADDPLGRAPGEPLWPDWETADQLAAKRRAVGERAWAALFQQSPRPTAGGLFATARIARTDRLPDGATAVRAWDLAATEAATGRDPDWTVGLKLMKTEAGGFIVADIVRLQAGPAAVEQAIAATARADGRAVPICLPQDPGQAGRAQVHYLAGRFAGHRVIASPETGAKITRAMPAASQIDAGNLTLLAAPWNRAFLDELRDFPHGSKDDQVDALSRAFAALTESATPARRLRIPLLAR